MSFFHECYMFMQSWDGGHHYQSSTQGWAHKSCTPRRQHPAKIKSHAIYIYSILGTLSTKHIIWTVQQHGTQHCTVHWGVLIFCMFNLQVFCDHFMYVRQANKYFCSIFVLHFHGKVQIFWNFRFYLFQCYIVQLFKFNSWTQITYVRRKKRKLKIF